MSDKSVSGNSAESRFQMNSFPRTITDHLILDAKGETGASISIKPLDHAFNKSDLSSVRYSNDSETGVKNDKHVALNFESLNGRRQSNNLDSQTIPQMNESYMQGRNSTIEPERVPLPIQSKGFVHISDRDDKRWKEKLMDDYNSKMRNNENGMDDMTLNQLNAPYADYVTEDVFQKIHNEFKGENGKFLAMTAYGAVPLPEEMMKKIPDKFVIKPIIEEREVFVNKQEAITRVSEKEFTQYTHKFSDINKVIYVDKIKPIDEVTIVEVPFFKYKPIVEEKIVEVPCGIKYVEIPIEIPCRIPPRIVPVGKEHFVERIIEASKPVVQEKIVEVQEVVHKKVPKVVIKEIPYIVPRYVEKIIEVPYKLENQLQNVQGVQMSRIPTPPPLPIPIPDNFKRNIVNDYYQMTEKPLDEKIQRPYGSIENSTFIANATHDDSKLPLPETFYLHNHIKHIKLPYEAEIDVSVVENSDIPRDASIINPDYQNSLHYDSLHMQGTMGNRSEEMKPTELPPSALNPVIEHTNPQMRAVEFRIKQSEPEVLTQGGVVGYSSFENSIK